LLSRLLPRVSNGISNVANPPMNVDMEKSINGAIIEYDEIIMQLQGIIITPNRPIATAIPNPVALNFVGYNSVVN
jgi:hypothetical protein